MCHNQLRPLMIPPILNKAYDQYPGIQALWATALREIEKCSEVIIWGYSLAPTDFYSSWLLRQGRAARRICVINPACLAGSATTERRSRRWNRQFLDKFKSVFAPNIGLKAKLVPYLNFRDFNEDLPISRRFNMTEY